MKHKDSAHFKRQRSQGVRRCPRCGLAAVELRRCKLTCANCGYQECCADACLIEYPEDAAEWMLVTALGQAWSAPHPSEALSEDTGPQT